MKKNQIMKKSAQKQALKEGFKKRERM